MKRLLLLLITALLLITSCASPSVLSPSTSPPSNEATALNRTQREHAATIMAVGEQMGVPTRGILVALAVASQESKFQNFANDGIGRDLAPDQRDVAQSLQFPHDAVGTDHGSVNVFQQQYPWWGSLEELMNPSRAARKFYTALLQVDHWQQMPVTVAAQSVQRSAFPDAYADDERLARDLLARASTSSPDPERG